MSMPALDAWTYGAQLGPAPDVPYVARDEVRFLCQDTDPNVRLLADAEVDYLIRSWIGVQNAAGDWQGGEYDHPLMAAHGCALAIAAKFAGTTTINADGVQVALGDLQEKYKTLASDLEVAYGKLQDSGEVDLSNLEVATTWDPAIRPTWAGLGMHDNPEAGQQDFGGEYGGLNGRFGPDRDEFASSP